MRSKAASHSHNAQRIAADPAASVWVAASAGSGKTKVLTDRVLMLLLRGTLPQRILCLTFTKAAAAEMANRVGRVLMEWTIAPESVLVDRLSDLTGQVPDSALLRQARRLFAAVLDAPGGLRIQTIHSFCESLLARFPIESGLSPQTQVMDERRAAELMRIARDAVLVEAESETSLRAALAEVTAHVQDDQFTGLINAIAGDRGRLAHLLMQYGSPADAERAVFRKMGVNPGATAADAIAEACHETAFDREALRRVVEALLAGTGKTDGLRGRLIAGWLEADEAGRVEGFTSYLGAFLTRKMEPFATPATKSVLEKLPEAGNILGAEAARLMAVLEQSHAALSACGTAALLRLGASILDRYETEKRVSARLDYDDLIYRVKELLTDREMTAWVLFKLDGGLDHILIDESQDTNPEQWEIVAALAEEFFSGEGAREGVVRTVFAVGDRKQSIFSFQRADPAVGEALRRHFAARVQEAGQSWREVPLDTSFRSTPAVLRVVDEVFAEGAARQGVVADGEVLAHEPFRIGAGGRVELWPLATAASSEEPEPWTPPVSARAVVDPETRLARVLAESVRRWIGTEILPARGRTVRPDDILILVRSRRRRRIVERLVRAFKEEGIPVAGVDRMILTEQISVMDLMALAQFVLLPEDDLTLATVLKGPMIGFDDDDLFRLAYQRGDRGLWRRLAEEAPTEPRYEAARRWLGDLLGKADFILPYELFAVVLAQAVPAGGSGRQAMVARLGTEAEDPIDEFLNLTLAYERAAAPSLQGFLHWVAAGETEIKRDLEQGVRDEVRIMTVHGAKGLQAPIVILADTTASPRGDSNRPKVYWSDGVPLWAPRRTVEPMTVRQARETAERLESEEANRLLYVAMTRAEDRLYICGATGTYDPAEGCWYDLVASAVRRIALPTEIDLSVLVKDGGWKGEGFVVESPQTTPAESADSARIERVILKETPSWMTSPPPAEKSLSRPLSPSRPEEADPPPRPPLGRDGGRRFRRGLIVHRLLELLPTVDADRRRAVAAAFLSRPVHALDATECAALELEVMAVIEAPDFAPIFGPRSRAEVGLVGAIQWAGQPEAVAGQVDRLVVTRDEVLVVDFKTMRPVPADVDEIPAAYIRQMAVYRALLRGIFPGRRVRCALLWTEGPILTPLPDGLLDRQSWAS